MKKALIWDISFPNTNSGGPAGYLYNLREYLNNNKNEQIVFLSQLLPQSSHSNVNKNNDINKSKLWKLLYDFKRIYNLYFRKSDLPLKIDLTPYSLIHFHVIYDVFRYRDYIKNYNGVIMITSHMPEPPIVEISNSYFYIGKLVKFFKEYFIKFELAFLNKFSPHWLFPASPALEPYIDSSKTYKKYFSCCDTIHYLPTCILDAPNSKIDNYFSSKYGIPQDSIVFTYIGRHNEIKGFDVLKKIGEKALERYKNLYFVIAGKEEPITGLKHERWIELGWINNSHEIISNSDLFILPNKQTYFDLIVLEVLRANTPLLTTYTGGNKYFKDAFEPEDIKGIMFFDSNNVDDALNQIDKFISNKNDLEGANRKLWENYFQLQTYVRGYVNLINRI